MKKRMAVLLVFLGLSGEASVGNTFPNQDFEALFREVQNQWEEDYHHETLEEVLWERYHDPLELNQASREEIQPLCIITDDQIDALFKHIDKNGPLICIDELQVIPEFDLPTIQQLRPFVRVEDLYTHYSKGVVWQRGLAEKNSYAFVRYERVLEKQQGYQRNKKQRIPYAGSPDKVVTRLEINHPQGYGLGFSASKGAGEAFTWDGATQRYGFSNWRFHGLVKERKVLKQLVVGDYAVGYGQGLVLNTGFSMDKSAETIKVIRTGNVGIKPHKSLGNVEFRGVANTLQWGPLELTTYYSQLNLDGKVEKDGQGKKYVATVLRGGAYKTSNELSKRNRVGEQVVGATLVYKAKTRGPEVGVNVVYTHYSMPLYPTPRQDSNPLRFRGQDNANGSLFYRYPWRNLHFFGEGGIAKSGGKACLLGVVASLSRYVDTTLLWRHYQQNFHSLYGKSFRTSSDNSNEQGIYLGARVSPLRHLHLDGYYDYFFFPWCWGKIHDGHSWLGKASYQFSRTALVSFQYKTKS
jgi:hypothetical protein